MGHSLSAVSNSTASAYIKNAPTCMPLSKRGLAHPLMPGSPLSSRFPPSLPPCPASLDMMLVPLPIPLRKCSRTAQPKRTPARFFIHSAAHPLTLGSLPNVPSPSPRPLSLGMMLVPLRGSPSKRQSAARSRWHSTTTTFWWSVLSGLRSTARRGGSMWRLISDG